MTINIKELNAPSSLTVKMEPLINIGVSLDSLLDFTESYKLWQAKGKKAYTEHMRHKVYDIMEPGRAFPFVMKMLTFNGTKKGYVRLNILSCSTAATVARAKNSLAYHGLLGPHAYPSQKNVVISDQCNSLQRAITEKKIDFFLSTNPKEVSDLLASGFSAGLIENGSAKDEQFDNHDSVVIATDFDRVLGIACGDPKDQFYYLDEVAHSRRFGVEATWEREGNCSHIPAHKGPVAPFFQKLFSLRDIVNNNPRQYNLVLPIVTARTNDSLARINTTLAKWGISPDDIFSTGYNCKGDYLNSLRTDLFLDDSPLHIEEAHNKSPRTLAAHVPWVRTHIKRLLSNGPEAQ